MDKFYKPRAMDIAAHNILQSYDAALVNGEPCEIPIAEIVEFHFGIRVEYRLLTRDLSIYGMTIFEHSTIPIYNIKNKAFDLCEIPENTILIDTRLSAKNRNIRARTTLAHELAHYLIHAEHFLMCDEIACKSVNGGASQQEAEAEELVTALLLPLGRVKVAFKRLAHIEDRGRKIFLLANTFGVSVHSMEHRLHQMALY